MKTESQISVEHITNNKVLGKPCWKEESGLNLFQLKKILKSSKEN